ncbi:tRNA threonylcarbamoyladenosine biosynthesis protein RimN, partial [Vibrio vulnificus]|nr:tRNA threonylcarbamoyladenosine biosynthesis protein RimN [Vibrio vulnificus]HAS8181959.1 tRNA threonylcarbamoyladenosine biosynthesis protein RimN [Vibrio vulnificus]HAS8555372.1 tRNA threonylcarbamoyladenosine biosynthesis protein RimN [Vibrio vulnificus]
MGELINFVRIIRGFSPQANVCVWVKATTRVFRWHSAGYWLI